MGLLTNLCAVTYQIVHPSLGYPVKANDLKTGSTCIYRAKRRSILGSQCTRLLEDRGCQNDLGLKISTAFELQPIDLLILFFIFWKYYICIDSVEVVMTLETLSCCTSFELEAEMHDRAFEAFIYCKSR